MFAPLIDFIECQTLYNMLNEGIQYAKINDRYYLYLLDCRPRADYNESHIITSKNIKRDDNGNFKLPNDAELESRNTIVVYDSNTGGTSTDLTDGGLAIECAQVLSENGSKNTVMILKGGFELFSRFYPFLRTQKIIYMPRELEEIKTYPSEIIPGLLYLGNSRHGKETYIKKHLKLVSFVDCTSDVVELSRQENSIDFLKVSLVDSPDESIADYLQEICSFIDNSIKDRKVPCLVYSNLGISRSAAIVIAYLVFSEKLSIKEAFEKVNNCKKIQPQIEFLKQIKETFAN